MICLKVSPTSETYREETVSNHQWDNDLSLKVSPTSEHTEKKQKPNNDLSQWAPPVRHIEKKHKLNNDLSQSELHQSDIQRRNRN